MSDPLVLLPGLNCSAALWSKIDVGPAIVPILSEPTLDGQVDRLLDELPGRFSLAGLSLGGIVAMALTRRAPERVGRLCLLSTTSRPPTSRQYAMWARQREALAAGATARDLQRELKAALLSPVARARHPDLVETTLAMADSVGTAALDAQLSLQSTRVDERPGLAKVRCPTLIVAGEADALVQSRPAPRDPATCRRLGADHAPGLRPPVAARAARRGRGGAAPMAGAGSRPLALGAPFRRQMHPYMRVPLAT